MADQQDAQTADAALAGTQTKRCVACKQEIPAGASICSVCKSYQRPWKNHLIYISGIATMLALIVSAGFWLWGNGRVLLGLGRDDVRLVSANTLGSAVVVHRGDQEVYVSHLLLTMRGRSADWLAPRLLFEDKLPVGQFLRREFPKPRIEENAEFIRGLPAVDFERQVKRAANGDSCVELTFFISSDTFLRELNKMAGPNLNTFEVGGYLEYWQLHGDAPVDLPVKGTGVVRRSSRQGCQ